MDEGFSSAYSLGIAEENIAQRLARPLVKREGVGVEGLRR